MACPGAPDNGLSTSCDNHYFNNKMGQVPAGFTFPKALDQFGVPHSEISAATMPNGVDFWWDEWSGNTGNCWFDNQGPDGKPGSVTGPGPAGRMPGAPPSTLPDCAGGKDPGSSVGPGDVAKVQYALDCSNGPDKDTGPMACDWWFAPAKPGSAEARRTAADRVAAARAYAASPEGRAMGRRVAQLSFGG